MVKVDLSDELVERLKEHAEPLVDTFESVIVRLLDAYDAKNGKRNDLREKHDASVRDFSPMMPPDLKHTKVLLATMGSTDLTKSQATWNGILNWCVELAVKNAENMQDLRRLLLVNFVSGQKEDEGYRFLPDIGLSIQGQDANTAWKATFHILRALDHPATVVFSWRDKDDALFPGVIGRFIWGQMKV